MGFWSVVALAVVCGCLLEAYRTYAKTKSHTSRTTHADIQRLETRLASMESSSDLEERVRALEAIVTDPKFRLDQEIANLNSPPQPTPPKQHPPKQHLPEQHLPEQHLPE